MIAFSTGQCQALRQLAELWNDTRFCLIGASALTCQIDLPRRTDDLDISVSVSLDELAAGLPRLEGWKRNPNAGVGFDHASAYLLGYDLRQLVNDAERRRVDDFLARVQDERHPSATQARMARLGPSLWNQDPDELLARVEAFALGFGGNWKEG